MAFYAIGDLHLSGAPPTKPMDVFGPQWKDHREKIIQHWKETIGTDDTIILCGDTSWSMDLSDAIEKDFSMLSALPGKKIILKGKKPLTERPGKSLAPVDFDAVRAKLAENGYKHEAEDINAYCQYPKVFEDYNEKVKRFGDVSVLDTPTFFFGMKKNEELHVEIEEGKDLIITLINISDPDESGVRTVTFMFNGAEREIRIQDKSVDMKTVSRRKADPDKAGDIGATLSGSVVNVLVSKGQKVKKGEPLVVTEAMKMETTITSPIDGTVGEIYAVKGQAIISGDCLLEVLE